MHFKSLKLFPIVILLALTVLIMFGCGKQGTRFGNIAPTIQITSYEGWDPANPYTDSTAVTLFQQRIYWHASDQDGVVAGYAYRILDENGNPMSTAGNAFIDSMGTDTPQEVIEKYGKGWVLHYSAGADQSIPLDDPRAKKTIWSNKKYATVNFIAATAAGDSITTISRFEVICIDNRGAVSQNIAFRRFQSYSRTPICYVSTTKGNPEGREVGTGIRLSFVIKDFDPFISETAWYYKFKLQKVDRITNAVISEDPADGWISTQNLPKINEYLLTKYTNPALRSDFDSLGVQRSFTRVIARVVDLAGIESASDSIFFAVKEGFHPKTLVHLKRIYALGSNHFIDYADESTPEVLPYTIVNQKQIFATPFFRDMDGFYTAVNSINLKSWIRWGWHGEYGTPLASGGFIVTDDPYDKKIDLLLDEDTDKNYFSEITYFDLRLNGEPYNYPPLANSIVTDQDTGKRWLRVPINSPLGQTIVLTHLPANTPDFPFHHFEVRAVDLQDEIDPTPAEFKFKVINPVEKDQKAGILIIDDEPHNPNFAPEDSIDAKYYNMLSSYSGEVVLRKRTNMEYSDIRNRKFALTDIQSFKFIIYHDDFPTQTSNLNIDHDAFSLYLNQGGNMLVSAGGNLQGVIQAVILAGQQTFNTYFGIQYRLDSTASVTGNILSSTWFVKAKSDLPNQFQDMDLAFDLNVTNPQPQDFIDDGVVIVEDPNESYLPLINQRKGLGPVTYFNYYDNMPNSGVTPIYKYGSKPVYPQPTGTPPASNYYCPQTEAEFNSVNDKIVGLKKVTPNNKCYIVGFPLSYMTKDTSKQFMTAVLNEIMGN
ncbi:MAG: hypothetical protein R6V77_03305 [Candidatus Cloacimonadaceae bacterium]